MTRRFILSLVLLVLGSATGLSGQGTSRAPKQTQAIPDALLRQIVSDHQPYLGTYGGSGAEFGRALEVDRIDLNGDGIVEFVVSGSPSFCGNRLCTFDVYRESRAGFESLTEGGLVKGTGNRIVLGKTRIKGYLDLVEKNGNRSVQRCRFDGRRYK